MISAARWAPFDWADINGVSMGYLSGFYADLPDVDYGVYRDKIAQVEGDMAYDVIMSKIKHHLCTYDAIGEPEEAIVRNDGYKDHWSKDRVVSCVAFVV